MQKAGDSVGIPGQDRVLQRLLRQVILQAPGGGAPLQDTTYVVQRGDTAYALSRQFDVPVKAIIDANGLQPPYGLIAGARLVIPRPRAHLVVAGDTVSRLSEPERERAITNAGGWTLDTLDTVAPTHLVDDLTNDYLLEDHPELQVFEP